MSGKPLEQPARGQGAAIAVTLVAFVVFLVALSATFSPLETAAARFEANRWDFVVPPALALLGALVPASLLGRAVGSRAR